MVKTNELSARQRQLLGLVLALGLGLRCVIAARSVGSNDAELWKLFAFHIAEHGVADAYRESIVFNHPPLMGWISWLSLELAQLMQRRFIYVFKALTILSEVGCAWLLWSRWREQSQLKAARVLAVFSLSLIAILLSSYHGNTDCLFATLCLASACALQRERWLWAGLALGAAINVKVVPLMLIPVFAGLLPSWRAAQRFGAGLALCALPFLPALWQAREDFVRNVLGYNSIHFQWGIPLLIESTQETLPGLASWLGEHYVPNARYVILGFMLLIGGLLRRQRTLNAYEAGALGLSVFLVLVPGFGVQYLVWPLPLLLAAHPRTALKYSLYGGTFALLVYYLFWTGTDAWFSAFSSGFPMPAPFLGVLAWVTLIGYCVSGFRQLLGGTEASSAAREIDASGVFDSTGASGPLESGVLSSASGASEEPGPALLSAQPR